MCIYIHFTCAWAEKWRETISANRLFSCILLPSSPLWRGSHSPHKARPRDETWQNGSTSTDRSRSEWEKKTWDSCTVPAYKGDPRGRCLDVWKKSSFWKIWAEFVGTPNLGILWNDEMKWNDDSCCFMHFLPPWAQIMRSETSDFVSDFVTVTSDSATTTDVAQTPKIF